MQFYNIFDKISEKSLLFYKLAQSLDEDQDLYQELIVLSQKLTEAGKSDIQDEVLLIAQLYDKVIQLNNGFRYVMGIVNNFLNQLESEDDGNGDDPVILEVSSVIENVYNDLNERAKKAGINKTIDDNPEAKNALIELKNSFQTEEINKDIKDYDIPAAAKARADALNKKEEGKSPELGTVIWAPKELRNWGMYYANKTKRYITLSEDIEKPLLKKNILEIIEILKELAKEAMILEKLNVSIAQGLKPDPKEIETRNISQEKLNNLRETYSRAFQKLRFFEYGLKKDELESEIPKIENPKEKLILEQELALVNSRIGNDRGIKEVNNLRLKLITALKNQGKKNVIVLTEHAIKNMLDEIERLENQRRTRKDIDIEVAEKVFKEKGGDPTIERRVGKGGAGWKVTKYNYELASLKGIITHATEKFNSERNNARIRIKNDLKHDQIFLNSLEPYLKAIADAANLANRATTMSTNKSRSALLKATKELNEKIREHGVRLPSFIIYLDSIRMSKFFKEFTNKTKLIDKLIEKGETENLDQLIEDLIVYGEHLIKTYNNYQLKMPARSTEERKGMPGISMYWDTPLKEVQAIINKLKDIKNAE